METLYQTVFCERHASLGANMVPFGGWNMPLHYTPGIVEEHLATRRHAGLFDVSHMGRFVIRGKNALPFLQHVLTNNAAALEVEESQYAMIPNGDGGAVDDVYLYRFFEDEYLLVVNAANRDKDLRHLTGFLKTFEPVDLLDRTEDLAMLSLQGPDSKAMLAALLSAGHLPEPMKNRLSVAAFQGTRLLISRTGYTGEPIGFELFIERDRAIELWDALTREGGAQPVGLGARDTLRLEAGLPLYGHELGTDPDGGQIPVFAFPLARYAVSLSPLKGAFVGRESLSRQFAALKKNLERNYECIRDLPRKILPVALKGRGIARAGDKVFRGQKQVGYVTSGTMIPFWKWEGLGIDSRRTTEKGRRAIGLALVDSDLWEEDEVEIEIRGKRIAAVLVPYHLRGEAPPHGRPILYDQLRLEETVCQVPPVDQETVRKVRRLVDRAAENTIWRQRECINLIPSEQTPSVMARLLSITDPMCRYAEHKKLKAFSEAEVFYYQGTDFIAEVEDLLICEFQKFLGCPKVETRVISGQMANTAVFSALVDYLNRADRKSEQRRMRKVMNHHIIKGGHLSAQPMGALRDFVMRDPQTEKPAVVNFPMLEEDPFQVDLQACRALMEEHRPELIIFGRSMTLYREPVSAVRALADELSLDCCLMYDMAHVLGLTGPHFQEPFKEGADLVTGSTHKTFYGTQRGVIGSRLTEEDPRYELWQAVERRAFPGSVSNHHLGTMVGLLLAAYEMNAFKDAYQKQVMANAKAFATALRDCGFDVAGDPAVSHTETHQVILQVGYARGAETARLLEENNIIVNYQAAPDEEGFTAAGSLRMGVAEMTRFGMKEGDFQELAQLFQDLILKGTSVKGAVVDFRKRFLEMAYCFKGPEFEDLLETLPRII